MATRGPKVWSRRKGRWMLNAFPPLFFSRVRVLEIGEGFRSARVRVRRSLLTRNLNGTTFGGAIFSGADPIYAVLYWQVFARRGVEVQTWLKTARIEYRRPAQTHLELEFALSESEIEAAAQELEGRSKFVRTYGIEAKDTSGEVCAFIETEVYVRRLRGDQREVSGF